MVKSALLLIAFPCALLAQAEPTPPKVWIDQLYPYFSYNSIDGFWFGGHYGWVSPIGFAERAEPYFGRIGVDAAASTEGSYTFIANAQMPAYWDGLLFELALFAVLSKGLGYYCRGDGAAAHSEAT